MGQRHLLFVAILTVALALGAGAGAVQTQETPEPDTDRADGAQAQGNDSTQDSEGDQFEPNDDFDTATPVGDGMFGNLTIEDSDVDVYAVNVTAGQPLSASIAFEHDEGDLDMALLDRNRLKAIAVSDGVTDNESVSYVPAESGTVYVVVAGSLNATNTYTLTVDGAAGDGDGTADVPTPDDATGDGAPPGPEDAAIRTVVGLEDENSELGIEDGIAAGESLDVSQADGLSAAEIDAAVSRVAARAEELRGLEFREPVSVAVVSREDLSAGGTDATLARLVQGPYLNQVYEATFIVDEETDAVRELQARGGTTVGGFYVPSANTLVVVSDSPQRPQVDESILVHELVHALQDQHLDLERVGATDALADQSAATLGLVEGDAEYVRAQFLRECESEWECLQPEATLEPPDQGTPDRENVGIAAVTLQPYSDGPALVAQLRESGGWSAVNDAYEDPPASTEQVIHPDRYPEEEPGSLAVENTPREGWSLFGTDRLGEAWIYTMFWYQGVGYDNPIVDPASFTRPDQGEFDTYNYTSAPSEGWDNDQLRMYTRDGEFGYVWTTQWDSEADATEFREAYQQLLGGQGAEQRDNGTWVIPEGEPYADAFAVVQDGQRVTIVNGPESADLGDIAPDVVEES